ncbi:Multicopper oxidase LPR1-like protein 1 [Phytophthora ramorum]|uniref:Multicopper oxidase LPR1-like protein 1 n=1 Tax=Phytophthora ramorum TaxID=164328 RepID=UPI0030B78D09|nr:Multicopper oxidase LPR1-like protein 1 [Phytophthora ramorum]
MRFLGAAAAVTVAWGVSSPVNALTDLKEDWQAYTSELPIPKVIDLTNGGAIEMQIGRSTHNWTGDGSISGAIYGYALKNETPSFPGPTIKVAKGVPINITWYNELDAPHLLQESVQTTLTQQASQCYPYCGVPVVTHVHGMESPARYDGLPFLSIYKNQTQEFHYLNNQSGSTKTYHDHSNGLTRLNTWAGLVGLYIIEDAESDKTFNLDIETDIPLALADRLISNSGKIMYSDDNCNEGATLWVPESFGTVNLVNGVVMPYVKVPPAQVRFRLVNVANARHYNLTVPFADKCKVVATDSGYVGSPTALSADLVVFPFERVEFVCDFTGVADGTTYDLVDKQTSSQATIYDNRVMRFRIVESLKTSTMKVREIPSTLTPYKSLKELYEAGGKERTLILGEIEETLLCPSMSLLLYRSQQVNTSGITGHLHCTKGTVEKWNFQNPTDDPHPFHWHVINAQCGETEDTVNTNALKDVVVIPNADGRASDTITQVCYVACTPGDYLLEGSTRGAKEFNFETTEPYVAHCHILEHEENAMMAFFNIMDVDDGYADDNGITPGTQITNTVIATAMCMSVLGGLATTLSILVISVKSLNFLASPTALAVAFALSSGVMLFIGLADLFAEALTFYRAAYTTGNVDPEAYEKGGSTSTGVCDNTCNGNAYLTTVAAFFGGVLIILFVEFVVHGVFNRNKKAEKNANENLEDGAEGSIESPAFDSLTGDQGRELESPRPGENAAPVVPGLKAKEEFRRAGVMTGIAVAIHNFPEGLALFVSSLSGLRSGVVLSIGIILHNFPEGVAIAAPVYYATGSKMEAFKWTALSGIAQPCGAAIGWAAVSGGMSFGLQASLYGVVAGMLVCITVKELIKGAYKFDPKGKVFVVAFFGGMAIIAFSIMALKYAGSS